MNFEAAECGREYTRKMDERISEVMKSIHIEGSLKKKKKKKRAE